MMLALFLKECATIGKSIIYLVFVCAIVLFYATQMGEETMEIIKPQEGEESYGYRYDGGKSEKVMPEIVSFLAINWKDNHYTAYNFIGIGRHVELSPEKQAEIAQIIYEITGVGAEELYEPVMEALAENEYAYRMDIDFSGIVPIRIAYDEFKEKMKRIDKILGGSYGESHFKSHGAAMRTYEEALADYNALVYDDMTTGAYARLFCDYMGIAAALLSVFVPVAFLMRDRRAKANDVIFSRSMASAKFIVARYAAAVAMMTAPFLLLSLAPTIYLAKFALGNGLPVDMFAFAKYSLAWILPTLMTTAAVAFVITTATDSPLAIALQFAWSLIDLICGSVIAYDVTGNLIHYGMSLIIRHNDVGYLQYYKDNLAQLAINRVFYAALSIALVALSIFIYDRKRRGEIDVRGSLRKIFGNRKSAD